MKNEKMIRQKRLEAQFMQLLNESFADLDDPIFAGISVTHVVVSKGKYDARVFVRCDDETQKTELLRHLKAASGAIREYCLQASGWFRCPKLHFEWEQNTQQQLLVLLDSIAQEHSKQEGNKKACGE